jgi:hypothetical protein
MFIQSIHHLFSTEISDGSTVQKWGNSLALRIPKRLPESSAGGENGRCRSSGRPPVDRHAGCRADFAPAGGAAGTDHAETLHDEVETGRRRVRRSGEPRLRPERGDVVWLTFTPQAGHEQASRDRGDPSPAAYNGK